MRRQTTAQRAYGAASGSPMNKPCEWFGALGRIVAERDGGGDGVAVDRVGRGPDQQQRLDAGPDLALDARAQDAKGGGIEAARPAAMLTCSTLAGAMLRARR